MYQSSVQKNKKEFKIMNFNHLMSIYETNYHNFRTIIDYKDNCSSKFINTRCL